MMDILFLNLHRRYLNLEPTHGGFLGIYLLAAFVRREGFDAKSFSGTLERGLAIIDELCSARSVSMIGLYCDFDNVTENIFLSRHIRDQYQLPVIVGGPQATALDENFFAQSKCNAVVRYEGELTVLELMNYYLEDVGDLKDIRGISYPTVEGIIVNPERPLIRNLDALPFIDEDCFIEPAHFYRGLSIMTGRGCPFRCAFCHEGAHTRTVRFRSVENVLAEVDAYIERVGRDRDFYLYFTDDTFTLNAERVRRLCEGLADRRRSIEFQWFCEGHVHTLRQHPEMIEHLAEGGCNRIQLGIEAGTDEVLKAYGKQSTPEEIIEVVRRCRDAGIDQVYGNIILGGAHFSREVFEADKAFAMRLLEEGQGVVELGAVTYWPLPETAMTCRPSEFGIEICDAEFLTSVGDFPQTRTVELDRLEIAEMQFELVLAINDKMKDMLEHWRVPTARVVDWLRRAGKNRYLRGAWHVMLSGLPVLHAYYEMLALDEGMHSSDVGDLSKAHPLRVASLYRHMRLVDERTVEISGEHFDRSELDVIMLTTGKLSVEEISARSGCPIERVKDILLRLERRHFIVFARH